MGIDLIPCYIWQYSLMVKQHLHTVLDIGSNPIIATINKNLTFKKIFVIIYMLRKLIIYKNF